MPCVSYTHVYHPYSVQWCAKRTKLDDTVSFLLQPFGGKKKKNIVSLVFFVTYVLCQPPSTVICRKVGPRIHLSLITLFWGVVMIGMGFVRSFGSMAALRVILGVLEAGFFPSCVYLLSTWYTRCAYYLPYLPFCCSAVLLFCCSAVLLFCCSAVLLFPVWDVIDNPFYAGFA